MTCSATEAFELPESDTKTDHQHFEQQLRDALAKIKLTPDFTIAHADYEPLRIPAHYRDYLKQMSLTERDRYLTVKLQQYLYAIFNHEIKPKQDKAVATQDKSQSDVVEQQQKIANHADKWYATRFYQQLTQCNHGQGYSDSDWLVVEQEAENQWKISKNGLFLHIDPQKHLVHPQIALQIGQKVCLKMPSNLVDHGLYIAVGNAGSTANIKPSPESTVIQLYFNVNSEGALLLLDRLTQQLNILAIPFDFKIAYDETNFPSFDAAILELQKVYYPRLKPILQNVYQESQAYFQPAIPFFCKYLASGLGLAEKPHQASDVESNNIGQYYCGIIAKSLLEIWRQKNECNDDKFNLILKDLSKVKINIKYLYKNSDSLDIY